MIAMFRIVSLGITYDHNGKNGVVAGGNGEMGSDPIFPSGGIIHPMNRLWFALALFLFQAQPQPQDRGSIAGFIVKMGTGEPLSKAVVTISAFTGGRSQSYTATTG